MRWAPNNSCGLRSASLSPFRISDYRLNKMILKEKYCYDSYWIQQVVANKWQFSGTASQVLRIRRKNLPPSNLILGFVVISFCKHGSIFRSNKTICFKLRHFSTGTGPSRICEARVRTGEMIPVYFVCDGFLTSWNKQRYLSFRHYFSLSLIVLLVPKWYP